MPEMIVAVDESSKDDRTIYCHCGRAPSGMRALGSMQFVRGDRYSLLAAMSVNGYISTRVVEGSVDTAKFFDFIVGNIVSAPLHCLRVLPLSTLMIAPNNEPLSWQPKCTPS